MYKMCNEFNNEINELKSDYLSRQDEKIDDVIENALLVYNSQLTRIVIVAIINMIPSQETIAGRVKLKPGERKKTGTGLKTLTPNKLLTRLPIILVQIKAGNSSDKLKKEIRQKLYLLYQHNKIIKKVYNNLIKSL